MQFDENAIRDLPLQKDRPWSSPMHIMNAGALGTAMLQTQMAEKIVKTQYLACNPERQFDRAERLRTSGDASASNEK